VSSSDDAAAPPAGAHPATGVRAPIKLRVEYQQMNAFFSDYTKNISKGAAFIKTRRPLPLGTRLTFQLALPALSEPLSLTGEVARVLPLAGEQEGAGGEPGMEIRFLFEGESARRAFAEVVERVMVESLGREATAGILKAVIPPPR
jgi:type IV pilus assembly protein PilZ